MNEEFVKWWYLICCYKKHDSNIGLPFLFYEDEYVKILLGKDSKTNEKND